MIWSKEWKLEDLAKSSKNTLAEHLDIRYLEIGPDFLVADMPVDHRTKQPAGLLHGGASVALAETLGSVASVFVLPDIKAFMPVGLEINANHLRAQTDGRVVGKVTPVHLGRSTHVWDIKISGADGKLACISRLTVAIVARK